MPVQLSVRSSVCPFIRQQPVFFCPSKNEGERLKMTFHISAIFPSNLLIKIDKSLHFTFKKCGTIRVFQPKRTSQSQKVQKILKILNFEEYHLDFLFSYLKCKFILFCEAGLDIRLKILQFFHFSFEFAL